ILHLAVHAAGGGEADVVGAVEFRVADVGPGAVRAYQNDFAARDRRVVTSGGIGGEPAHPRHAIASSIGAGEAGAAERFDGVVGVRNVDVGRRGEVGMNGDAEHPTVLDKVDAAGDIEKRR